MEMESLTKAQGKRNVTNAPEWVVDINRKLKDSGYVPGKSWTIYRVPRNLRSFYESSYHPKIIAIGPFHHGETRTHAMEEHKKRYLFQILGLGKCRRSKEVCQSEKLVVADYELETLVEAMKSLELDTRACYSETFNKINSNDFVKMMVYDGCFIIELFRFYHVFETEHHVDDPIFTTRWMLRSLQRDLLMLENQLPFFVLQKLFDLTKLDEEDTSLIDLTLHFFNPLIPRKKKMLQVDPEILYAHLLDLFRTSFISSVLKKEQNGLDASSNIPNTSSDSPVSTKEQNWLKESSIIPSTSSTSPVSKKEQNGLKASSKIPSTSSNSPVSTIKQEGESHEERETISSNIFSFIDQGRWQEENEPYILPRAVEKQLIHCVSELQEAGVTFAIAQDSDLLDVEFENGLLKIPALYIDDNTVPLFLNFLAYEQCDEYKKPYFTDHFMFLDSLVNSPEDVGILHKYGIINHVLGSDKDVTYLFNKLGREIVYDVNGCHLAKEMKEVNTYYKDHSTKWHIWWINLINTYFSSPWTFISLLAAILLLALTIAQTFFAAYSYFHRSSTS